MINMAEIPSDLSGEVLEYLTNHRILTMATADNDGNPDATALEYVNDQFVAFVSVRPGSKKIRNIKENPRVFYEIHDEIPIDLEHVQKVKAIQTLAEGQIIFPDTPEYQNIFLLFEKKYPVFSKIPKNKRILLKFVPKKIWFLNYAKKMFHRDEISF
jgi:uncharacterized pyridoxamine 5'-phosphate oxidase family protein